MLRFVVRYGLIRVVGRRAVPALMLWDAAVMANRARQIPIVDRTIRRGAGAAMRGAADVAGGRYRPARPGRPAWPRRPGSPSAAESPPDGPNP